MPQIKNQEKRVRTNAKSTVANVQEKTRLKTAIKSVLAAVNGQDKEAAAKELDSAKKLLDKSVTSGIHHKNYASRQKSRLEKAVNSIAA